MRPLACVYPPPLTRLQLDVAVCAVCGGKDEDCKHDPILELSGRCHPKAPTLASYDKRDGILTLRCAQCKMLVTRVKVANSDREVLN